MADREQLIERAMDDILANFYDYRKWIIDEMRNVVEEWDEAELKGFLGIEESVCVSCPVSGDVCRDCDDSPIFGGQWTR